MIGESLPRPTLDLATEADTARLGGILAPMLRQGEAICLSGPLGAGKSVLARALIRALNPQEREVPSPTYTLMQLYDGPNFPVAHFDLYRLTNPGEAFELGLQDALQLGAVVIEWPERLGDQQPCDRLEIAMSMHGDGRRAGLTPHGVWRGRAIEF